MQVAHREALTEGGGIANVTHAMGGRDEHGEGGGADGSHGGVATAYEEAASEEGGVGGDGGAGSGEQVAQEAQRKRGAAAVTSEGRRG